jgi:hypothetical protein
LIDAIVDIDIDYITGEVTDLLPDPDVVLVPASGNVVVADVVDPSPALSCYVVNPGDPADMTNTANPQNFSGYGTSTVSCTAMDSSGNTSSAATFDIGVSFPYEIELILPKGQARAGSTIPIDFRYYLGNTLIDSSSLSPLIQWIGPYGSNDSSCSNGTSGTGNGQDSGSSSLRYSASTDTYQFSWQTPDISESAFFLLIVSPPGVGFDSDNRLILHPLAGIVRQWMAFRSQRQEFLETLQRSCRHAQFLLRPALPVRQVCHVTPGRQIIQKNG